VAAQLSRQYVKFCDLRDFDDSAVRGTIRNIVPGRDPNTELERKLWEFAMLALFLEESGTLRDDTDVLAVGAGREAILFWLANRVGRIVATDIYGEGEFGTDDREAGVSMLRDASAHAPFPYRADRLEVLQMDARHLDFADASFDVVYSLSSIEHFGSPADIRKAAQEIGRVLRPGGYAVVVTECFVQRSPLNAPLVHFGARLASVGKLARNATPRRRALEVFTVRELSDHIVKPSGLRLLQPLDRRISPETWRNLTHHTGPGKLRSATGEHWPHILLKGRIGTPYTSVCLVMEKVT
jgi:ubiquinone/menaquinone biosynthesis C-methylase UbiE